MKAFEIWQKIRPIKTIRFLNTAAAYRYGEKEGWRTALEILYGCLDYSEGDKRIKDIIEKELEDK